MGRWSFRGGLLVAASLVGCRAILGIDPVTLGDPNDAAAASDGALVDAGPASTVCSKDGFCWLNPLPQGNTLSGVFATSERDAWAVGDYGTIIHFDGAVWSGTARDARDTYKAIAGDGTGRLWVGGARLGVPVLLTSTNGVDFAVVVGPEAGAPNGTTVTSAWFDGQDTLWYATDDGSVFTVASSGGTPTLKHKSPNPIQAISGVRGDSVITAGNGGQIGRYRYSDSSWSIVQPPATGGSDYAAVALAGSTVYVGGASSLVEITAGGPTDASFATPPADPWAIQAIIAAGTSAWAVGSEGKSGVVYERDAATGKWTRVLSGASGLDVGDGLVGLAAAGSEAWAVGVGGSMARRASSGAWSPAFTRRRIGHAIAALPASPSEVYVVSSSAVARFGAGGVAMEAIPPPAIGSVAMVGPTLWATSPDAGLRVRATDGSWKTDASVPVPEPSVIAAASATDVLVAGIDPNGSGFRQSAAARLEGAWKSLPAPAGGASNVTPSAAWPDGTGRYWVATNQCYESGFPCSGGGSPSVALLEAPGTDTFTDKDSVVANASGNIDVIWGPAPDQVYLGGLVKVGAASFNLLTAGATTTRTLLPRGITQSDQPVLTIHGVGSDIWAGGAPFNLWHKSGSTWETKESGTTSPITAMFVRAIGDVWIASDSGGVLHRAP
jgi:hypothetical protein